MFTKEVVGTANAVVAGWGNLGGGVTQLFMGTFLFPLFKNSGMSADSAWRVSLIVPAVITFIAGFLAIQFSDDAPKGVTYISTVCIAPLVIEPKVGLDAYRINSSKLPPNEARHLSEV